MLSVSAKQVRSGHDSGGRAILVVTSSSNHRAVTVYCVLSYHALGFTCHEICLYLPCTQLSVYRDGFRYHLLYYTCKKIFHYISTNKIFFLVMNISDQIHEASEY